MLICDDCFRKLGLREAYSCTHGYGGGTCEHCGAEKTSPKVQVAPHMFRILPSGLCCVSRENYEEAAMTDSKRGFAPRVITRPDETAVQMTAEMERRGIGTRRPHPIQLTIELAEDDHCPFISERADDWLCGVDGAYCGGRPNFRTRGPAGLPCPLRAAPVLVRLQRKETP